MKNRIKKYYFNIKECFLLSETILCIKSGRCMEKVNSIIPTQFEFPFLGITKLCFTI